MGALFGCSSGEPSSVAMAATGEGGAQGGSAAMVPKYVFLFIGDGMSYPQIQATAYFNGAQQRGGRIDHRARELHGLPGHRFPVHLR